MSIVCKTFFEEFIGICKWKLCILCDTKRLKLKHNFKVGKPNCYIQSYYLSIAEMKLYKERWNENVQKWWNVASQEVLQQCFQKMCPLFKMVHSQN